MHISVLILAFFVAIFIPKKQRERWSIEEKTFQQASNFGNGNCDTSNLKTKSKNSFKSEHDFRVAICIFWVHRIVTRVQEGQMGNRWGEKIAKSLINKDTTLLFQLGKSYKDSIIENRKELFQKEIPAPIYHLHALSIIYYCKMLQEVDKFIAKLHIDPYMTPDDFIKNAEAMADVVRPIHQEIAQELKNLRVKYQLDKIDLNEELKINKRD